MTRPADLSDAALTAQLAGGWGITAESIEYLAVGFGSHHWLVEESSLRWFVTVDDLDAKKREVDDPRSAIFERLSAALSAARSVADHRLEFVVAPCRAEDDAVVRRVDDRYAMAVYPFIDGVSYPYGEFQSTDHRNAVLEMIAQLHGVADPAATAARADDLAVPRRDDLHSATCTLNCRWDSGPFGESARELLDRHAAGVDRLFAHYDRLAARVARRPERVVLTHGEPHCANTLMAGSRWLLVDWDTTLIAAPERDLWMMANTDATTVDAYEAITGQLVLADGLDCYRLWWDLSEICGYVALLRNEHEETDDMRESWKNLRYFLDPTARWPQLVT